MLFIELPKEQPENALDWAGTGQKRSLQHNKNQASSRHMQSIDIRYTEKFPEPQFSFIQKIVFADIQQFSSELEFVLNSERTDSAPPTREAFLRYRLGAYDGERLVGWTFGWMERDNTFYMANSGILPSHRRRGIYTSLLNAVREHALAQGAWCIRSHHSVVNNPVIIAKLRAGFYLAGLSQSAQMGTLVELILHLSSKREDMFRKRVLPYTIQETSSAEPPA